MARQELAKRILAGLGEARDHAAGGIVEGLIENVPNDIDVAAIRKKTSLSQEAFARMIAVKLATLRNWEQGRRQPEGPARVLLAMVSHNPAIVLATLGTPAASRNAAKKTAPRKMAPSRGRARPAA